MVADYFPASVLHSTQLQEFSAIVVSRTKDNPAFIHYVDNLHIHVSCRPRQYYLKVSQEVVLSGALFHGPLEIQKWV